MSVLVRIPGPLRRVTNNQDRVTVEGANLEQTLAALESKFPGIRERLMDESGALRHFVNIYVNGEDVRFLKGLQTETKPGDEVSIVPAVAGGQALVLLPPAASPHLDNRPCASLGFRRSDKKPSC